jgi:hypothetical protein
MMFERALAMGIVLAASPMPSSAPVPSPPPAPPALAYTLHCAGYGNGTFAAAGIPIALPKSPGADASPSVFAPSAMAPLATRSMPVTIVLSSGTLATSYWSWFAQGPTAKPVDCEIDRDDADVSGRARFAVAGATIHQLSPPQPAPGSVLGSPAADSLWLDASSISLLTF